jgi:hypothetical protein
MFASLRLPAAMFLTTAALLVFLGACAGGPQATAGENRDGVASDLRGDGCGDTEGGAPGDTPAPEPDGAPGSASPGGPVTLQVVNGCSQTIWLGTLSSGGTLGQVEPQLAAGASTQLTASADWSGRLWGRTGCSFDDAGVGTCDTGDCGGQRQCAAPGQTPATLAEFTFAGAASQTFYDVSLVDGFNVPMEIQGGGASASCPVTACPVDVNAACPAGLEKRDASGGVVGCLSACEAFGTPEACCTGPYATPETCPPTSQAQHFKAQCPAAYSYAYDDATSTFTCGGTSFVVTFCP